MYTGADTEIYQGGGWLSFELDLSYTDYLAAEFKVQEDSV